jgi:hypothetical protein
MLLYNGESELKRNMLHFLRIQTAQQFFSSNGPTISDRPSGSDRVSTV